MFKHTTEHSFITKHVMKENTEYKKSGKRYSVSALQMFFVFVFFFCELHFQRLLLCTVHKECGRFSHKYDKIQN